MSSDDTEELPGYFGDDDFEEEVRQYPYLTPMCCKDARENKAVFLEIGGYDLVKSNKPQWVIRAKNADGLPTVVEARFCPFCAVSMPEIVPSDVTDPICICTDGGYYCDTCNERLSSCRCLPTVFAWKPCDSQ